MPIVVGARTGPAWGCTCPAFRLGESTPETVRKAMIRAADVTVEDLGAKRDTFHHFRAWTNPESKYSVTFNTAGGGGFCKHVAACAALLVGDWLSSGYNELRKENEEWQRQEKSMRREIKKLSRELTRSAKK